MVKSSAVNTPTTVCLQSFELWLENRKPTVTGGVETCIRKERIKYLNNMEKIKIVTLMEDNLCGDRLIAEHGLSLYIETEKHRILVDTGQSDRTWANAKEKGIDLSSIDTVFISHGHYDHSGGLMAFAAINPKADIYLHENAGGEYYSYKEGVEKYIGIDKNILKLPNLHLINENTTIDDELFIFTGVKPNRLWPKGNKRLHEKKNDIFVQDTFSHEQYLVIRYDDKYALISGCAHNGILNILDTFRDIFKVDPSIVISGFHMIQTTYTEEDMTEIRQTAKELQTMDTVFYTGHCTGEKAYGILKEIMGEKLQAIWRQK